MKTKLLRYLYGALLFRKHIVIPLQQIAAELNGRLIMINVAKNHRTSSARSRARINICVSVLFDANFNPRYTRRRILRARPRRAPKTLRVTRC